MMKAEDSGAIPTVRTLTAVAGLAGLGTMVIEMTAVRALAPAIGTSLYTWTNVIAVVLVALAVGAVWGGRIAAARDDLALALGSTLIVGGLLVVPGAFLAVPLGLWLLPSAEAMNPFEATGHLLRGGLAAALLLFAAPVLFLGRVGPLVVASFSRQGNAAGRAAGRAFSG